MTKFSCFFGKSWLLLLGNLLLAKLSMAALYAPGGVAGVGNFAALINDIAAANLSPEDDIIDLGSLVYTLEVINNNTNGNNGLPAIVDAATAGKLSLINGTIRRDFALSTATPFRLLAINPGAMVYLYNITLENGLLNDGTNSGGAIFNAGFLNLGNCILANNNNSNSDGGAIGNQGTIGVIQETIITHNQAGNNGGAIFSNNNTTITSINDSIISNNQAASGGGIYSRGTINALTNCTIADNQTPGIGGGIDNEQTGIINIIANSTFYGNIASGGGGIYNNDGTINGIINTTIYNNHATNGGGIQNFFISMGSISSVFSTIIAGNQAITAPDYIGSLSNEGFNLFSTIPSGFTPSVTDLIQANASTFFGILQNNGGKTPTVALLAGSLAINNGYNINNLLFDQRGKPYRRTAYGATDIGAFEFNSPAK